MPPRIRPTLRAAAAASLAAAAAGCLSSTTDVTGTQPTPTSATGVRVVQGVSDAAGGVDAGINGTALFYNGRVGYVYPPVGNGYLGNVPAAPRVTLVPDGGTTPIFDQTVSAIKGDTAIFTIIAYGRTAAGAAPAATATVLADTLVRTGASGPVMFRVFNTIDYVTSGSGTPVDVYIYPVATARPSTPDAKALAWGAASPYLVKQMSSGTMQVDVFAAGSTATPLMTTTVVVGAGSVRTLVLLDPPAGTGSTAAGAVLVLPDYN